VLSLPPRRSGRPLQSGCGRPYRLRPRDKGSTSGASTLSRLPLHSLSLRPGDSLTIPKMALSMGIRLLVSRQPAIQATRLLTLALVGLSPTERASLSWTHIPDGRISRIRFEAAASAQGPSCNGCSLSLWPTIRSATEVCPWPSNRLGVPGPSGSESGDLPHQIALRAQRSFAPEVLTAVHRYYDLMCQSRSLSPTSLLHPLVSLCSLDHLLLDLRTFPTLALRIFPWMLGPLPRLSQ